MKNTILNVFLSIYLIGCSMTSLIAQNTKANSSKGNSPLQKGQLKNGFTYYIYNDSTFKNEKVRMGFMVKAGGNKELPAEKEFAHMIEHIPFVRDSIYPEGTDQSSKHEIIPSADLSAITTYTHTKYWFHYPKSHSEAIQTGISWFKEIASDLRFDKWIINRVRSQVQGEMIYRMRTILQCSADKPYIDYRLYGKGIRDFCNIVNDMEDYKAQDLQAFYKRWYTPSNMGIFIVGNLKMSTKDIISLIKTQFGDLKQPLNEPKAIAYDEFYLSEENQFINIDTRDLLEIPEIQLYFRKPTHNGICTEAELQLSLLDEMVGSLVAKRFRKRSKSLNNQNIESFIFYTQDHPPSFMVTPKLKSATSIKKGLQLPIIEYRKIIVNGFTEEELQYAIKTMEDKYINREELSAKFIMDELYENFSWEDCFAPEVKARQTKIFLNTLTKKDLNRRMIALFNPKNKVDVVIKASDSSSYNLNKKQVYGWLDEAWKVSLENWEETLKGSKKIKVIPPRELLSQQEILKLSGTTKYRVTKVPEYGITEMDFPNGMKVVLKPFKPKLGFKDRLHLQVIKPGGASQFKDEGYVNALYSSQIVSASGLGTYSKQQLDAYLRQPGKGGFHLSPYVNHKEVGFRGWYLPGRLEDMLIYLYLHLTKPRVDSIVLANWKKKEKIKLRMDERNNDLKLRDFTRNFFIGQPFISEESIDAIEEKKVMDTYTSLFSNPKGYTMVISGDFDLDSTMVLCNKYLGGLPMFTPKHTLRVTRKKDLNQHNVPKGPLSFNLESDDPRKSDVQVVYSGRMKYTPKEDAGLYVLNMIFNDRLNNRLRNEEVNSTVYHVFSTYDLIDSNSKYKLNITFNCVNSKTEKMVNALKEEIDMLKTIGPDSEVLKNVLNNIMQYFMPTYEGNAEHMNIQLANKYSNNIRRVPMYKLKDHIVNITTEDIKKLAQKYLKEENYYQFIARKKLDMEKSNSL